MRRIPDTDAGGKNLAQSRPARYLVVGGVNTAIGYVLGVGLYLALSHRLHILAIGAIANVLAISFSFTTNKLFVFRTRGHWLPEYLRSYVVYGGMALLGTLLIWVLVDGLHVGIWVAQGLTMAITVVISYLGHSRYTFRPAQDTEAGQPK